MIVFRYKEESLGIFKGKIMRPVADVHLKTPTGFWIEFHPYIDSGADTTLIPLSLGKLIGLKINKNKVQQIGGISGEVPVINSRIYIRIGKKEFTIRIAWALIEDIPPLLGRADVFDIFNVTFQQKKGKIVFEEAS